MQIILLERVEKLGQMGDVVKVRNGYARNYLLPQNKALRATEENRKYFESRRRELEAHNLERKNEAEDAAGRMVDVSCVLIRQASEMGQLYGSVSSRDIAEALEGTGLKIERRQVVLDRPIKSLGVHEVRVALHPEVSVTVQVNVARSQAEAQQQFDIAAGIEVASEEDQSLGDDFELEAPSPEALLEDSPEEVSGAERSEEAEDEGNRSA